MKTIDVIVEPDGATTMQTHGFAGGDCLEATRQLEAALGLKTSECLTADFFTTPRETIAPRLGAGGESG